MEKLLGRIFNKNLYVYKALNEQSYNLLVNPIQLLREAQKYPLWNCGFKTQLFNSTISSKHEQRCYFKPKTIFMYTNFHALLINTRMLNQICTFSY